MAGQGGARPVDAGRTNPPLARPEWRMNGSARPLPLTVARHREPDQAPSDSSSSEW